MKAVKAKVAVGYISNSSSTCLFHCLSTSTALHSTFCLPIVVICNRFL